MSVQNGAEQATGGGTMRKIMGIFHFEISVGISALYWMLIVANVL